MINGKLIRIEFMWEGFDELRKDPAIAGICEQAAREKQAELGPGYEVETYNAQTRFVAQVVAKSKKAHEDNLDNNSLLKAFGGDIQK